MLKLNQTLKLNDEGPAVAVLYEYLQDSGYIQSRFTPSAFPLIETQEIRDYFSNLPNPSSPIKYDEELQKAVKKLQELGLIQSRN